MNIIMKNGQTKFKKWYYWACLRKQAIKQFFKAKKKKIQNKDKKAEDKSKLWIK